MADQHNDNVPAVGNSIAADIPDIKENLEWHKDLLQMILGWKSDTIATVGPPNHRSKFRWKDADEIYIGPGSYFHDGTTRQTVFWDSELTFQLGSGGSNAGSADVDAGAAAWHYIYLDDSAIVTQASPELDAGCFLNTDVTAPTWSDAKHGWYNGSDRCIFAVLQDSGDNILEFWHDGSRDVEFADQIEDYGAGGTGTPSNSFTDVTLTAPSFCTFVKIYLHLLYSNANGYAVYRTNGQTGTTGHYMGCVNTGATIAGSRSWVMTDSSQKIEVKTSAASTNEVTIQTQGWKLPHGM